MAYNYVKRRVSDVTKLSEVDAIWGFLAGYQASKTSSLTPDQLSELRELLRARVVNELMSPGKSPSDQRYLKLATISHTFDDSIRAFDIIFSGKEIATEVGEI